MKKSDKWSLTCLQNVNGSNTRLNNGSVLFGALRMFLLVAKRLLAEEPFTKGAINYIRTMLSLYATYFGIYFAKV
ncbi:hypothetical protein CWB41_02990 [Methylovirgula ligni]|nr:hypothetical protein CWB41_02990 [Methylovirgula ligni]